MGDQPAVLAPTGAPTTDLGDLRAQLATLRAMRRDLDRLIADADEVLKRTARLESRAADWRAYLLNAS